MKSHLKLFALLSAIVLLGTISQSATITGTVKGVDGAPYQGAFVQAQNTKTKITVNVLSDTQGHYRVEQLPAGDYKVTIRAIGFTAAPKTGVSLTADQNTSFDFALQAGTVRWSDINFYEGMKLFPESHAKTLIKANCSTCHEFQSRMAAVHRDQDGWRDRIEFMRHDMKVHITDAEADEIAVYLTSLFGPDSVLPKSPTDMPEYSKMARKMGSDALNIVYVEYDMPGPSRMPFSATPDKNGMIWIPNFGPANKITRLDPKTGMMQDFSAPSTITADIHSSVPAADGSVWLTEQTTNRLGRWDPVTQKITEYQDQYLPDKDGNLTMGSKHTVRLDNKGRVWASGGPFVMFDPETQKYTRFDQFASSYDVKPDKNGDVWLTSPGHNSIAKVDGTTLKVTEWKMPTDKAFPRRLEIGANGIVWVGEFNAGKMAKFDTKTQTFTEIQLPGPDPSPYAMGIDADGNVWYNSHHQDTVGMINPKTDKVTEYPFPHAEFCGREFFLDAQGRMWYGTDPNNKVGYFYLTGKGTTMAASN